MPSEITPFSSPIPSPDPTDHETTPVSKRIDAAEKALSNHGEALKEARLQERLLDKNKKSPAKSSPLAKLGLEKLDIGKVSTEKTRDADVDLSLANLLRQYEELSPDKKKNFKADIAIKGLIAQGAFKNVYHAYFNDIPVAMAVSIFKKWLECDESSHERVKCIHTAIKELESAHRFPPGLQIVYPLAVSVQNDPEEVRVTLLMPLMHGGGLNHLKDLDDLPDAAAIRLSAVQQFISAIHGLHIHGIFQRDINPANAMFTKKIASHEDVDVKLIDMGTHQRLDAHEKLALPSALEMLKVKTTPHYAAPEIAGIRDVIQSNGTIGSSQVDYSLVNPGLLRARELLYTDGKIDPGKIRQFILGAEIYAASVSAYEMLMGELPPPLAKILESCRGDAAAVTNTIISKVSQLDKSSFPDAVPTEIVDRAKKRGVPLDLLRLIWLGLNVDPAKRPQSLTAFVSTSIHPAFGA